MIPSRNAGIEDRAKKLYEAWLSQYEAFKESAAASGKDINVELGKAPDHLRFYPRVTLICDCCGSSLEEGVTHFFDAHGNWAPGEVYWKRYWGGFVEVSGTVYYGCKGACAQALFTIHHQYAMRAQSDEGRFIRNTDDGTIVDLDRVLFIKEHGRGVLFHIDQNVSVYMECASINKTGNWEWETKKNQYIEAWKKRRVRPEIV